MCIQILGARNHKYAYIGNIIIAVDKEAVPNMPLKKS
jgi:large subunit ribosomal protein L14